MFKIPNLLVLSHWDLEIGIYLGFGIWKLEFKSVVYKAKE